MRIKFNQIPKGLLFLVILLVVAWIYNYHEILFHGINAPHMWRQADCLSITMNYYMDNLNFFTPEIHWTGPSGHGKTISEFPIIYFSVAQLWKVFGHHEYIFRLINLLFVFGGLYSLYKISYTYLQDTFWAFFIPLFLFTSPALVYYSNNFLMNAPAFGIALTALFFYSKWDQLKQKKWLLFSMTLFLLAGLLKITSLIIFFAILGFLTIHCINLMIKGKLNYKKALLTLLPFILVLLVIFAWYGYARHYCNQNLKGIFLQGLYPIWDISSAKRSEILDMFYWNVLPSFFNKKALVIILLMFISIITLVKKIKKELYFLVLLTFIGEITFLILWFQAINIHDYYLINLLIIIPLITFTFLHSLKEDFNVIFRNKLFKTIAFVGLITLIYQASLITRIKYNPYDPWLKANIFLSKNEQELRAYKFENYNTHLKALAEINPYLRSIGINRNDLVVSLPDVSINISLYLMDQKGFTNYGYSETKGKITERLNKFIQIGAKYLVVNNEDAIEHEEFKYFTKNQIGEFRNVKIFKLPEISDR